MDSDGDSPAGALDQSATAASSDNGRPLDGIHTSGQHRQQADPAGAGRIPSQDNERPPPGPPGPPEDPAPAPTRDLAPAQPGQRPGFLLPMAIAFAKE
eukprot:13799807-Heterocapsa_arctica.AAC.1